MVFAYSEEAVGQLEHDLCTAQARIRELEEFAKKDTEALIECGHRIYKLLADVVRKDAALAAAEKEIATAIKFLERKRFHDVGAFIKRARDLIAAALKEEKA